MKRTGSALTAISVELGRGATSESVPSLGLILIIIASHFRLDVRQLSSFYVLTLIRVDFVYFCDFLFVSPVYGSAWPEVHER